MNCKGRGQVFGRRSSVLKSLSPVFGESYAYVHRWVGKLRLTGIAISFNRRISNHVLSGKSDSDCFLFSIPLSRSPSAQTCPPKIYRGKELACKNSRLPLHGPRTAVRCQTATVPASPISVGVTTYKRTMS